MMNEPRKSGLAGAVAALLGRRMEADWDGAAEQVGKFYDATHDKFLKVYGEVIQAFRTRDVTKLLDYEMESIGFCGGERALDAGCGVCGPAMYFAEKADITVEAVTVSRVQAEDARRRILERKMEGRVSVRLGDYHNLGDLFEPESFDVVYFLESFGHSHDQNRAIAAAWEVLRPGGRLYIKDLFKKEACVPDHRRKIEQEVARINKAYHYNIADLNRFLEWIRGRGFILQFLKTIDLRLEDFENLTISNDFQELTGIGRIENWREYIFPVDFFEVKCMKPVHEMGKGSSRYFLQNLYHLKVLETKMEDL